MIFNIMMKLIEIAIAQNLLGRELRDKILLKNLGFIHLPGHI